MFGLIAADILLLAVGVVMVRAVRRGQTANTDAEPRWRTRHPSVRTPQRADFGLTLVSVERSGTAFVIDGMLTEDDVDFGPAGWPVTMRVPCCGTASVDAWMQSMLDRWNADNVPVRFTLKGDDLHPRASITDGSSTLHFTVEHANRHAA